MQTPVTRSSARLRSAHGPRTHPAPDPPPTAPCATSPEADKACLDSLDSPKALNFEAPQSPVHKTCVGSIPEVVPFSGDILRRLAAGLSATPASGSDIDAGLESYISDSNLPRDPFMLESGSKCGEISHSIQKESNDNNISRSSQNRRSSQEAKEAAALRWNPRSRLPSVKGVAHGEDGLVAAAYRSSETVARSAVAPPLDARASERAARKAAPDTAGRRWFDLPATPITPEVKTDLRMLSLRGAFDPKRFYRNPDQTKFPKYFQMGTVVEGPTDFYSGRMTKSERKQTLTEELLADSRLVDSHKRRFGRLQAERSKFSKRKGVRKTSNPRLKRRPTKPKH